jgi:hypothetical protein
VRVPAAAADTTGAAESYSSAAFERFDLKGPARGTSISGAEHGQGLNASKENEPSRGDPLRWQTEQRGPIRP